MAATIPATAPTPIAPLLRHRTVFEAISDLASYQYQTLQQITDLSGSEKTLADAADPAKTGSTSSLLAKLINGPLEKGSPLDDLVTATRTIAAAADHWRKCIADKPRDVKGEEIIVLAECRTLSPRTLLPLLELLHQLDRLLAEIGLNPAQAPELTTAYGKVAAQIDVVITGNADFKALRTPAKALQMKTPSGPTEEVQALLAQQLGRVHEFTATAVAHCVANAQRSTP